MYNYEAANRSLDLRLFFRRSRTAQHGIKMEKLVRQGLLYDLYGNLLTEHQQKVYGELVNEDLSLSEIAELNGVSRQAVHDLIKRCDKILEDYEEKLGLLSARNAEHE